MGVSNSPDIFQENTNEMLCGFDFIWAYINGLLLINKDDWYDNLEKLELTLQNLKYNGLKCNIDILFFGQAEIEYIGFWVTQNVIRPKNKKV